MNFLIFNGSPRSKGTTSNLIKEFTLLLKEEGHSVYEAKPMKPCIHCSQCLKTGECVLPDSFERQGINIDSIDAIVLASPIHFFSITPKALSFLTRFYSESLKDKIFAPIIVSGSDFDDCGIEVIEKQFDHIDAFCGSVTVYPFHKVTYDQVWQVDDLDRMGLQCLLKRIKTAKEVLTYEAY